MKLLKKNLFKLTASFVLPETFYLNILVAITRRRRWEGLENVVHVTSIIIVLDLDSWTAPLLNYSQHHKDSPGFLLRMI